MAQHGNQGFLENSKVVKDGMLIATQSVTTAEELRRTKRELKGVRIAFEESALANVHLRVKLADAITKSKDDENTINNLKEDIAKLTADLDFYESHTIDDGGVPSGEECHAS